MKEESNRGESETARYLKKKDIMKESASLAMHYLFDTLTRWVC